MRLRICLIGFILGIHLSAQAAVLTLSSDSDLNQLMVGDEITINVGLSGLSSGVELDTLAASVNYDSTRFSSPIYLGGGNAVPSNLYSPYDFSTYGFDGVAGASFYTYGGDSGNHITGGGGFFSFSVTALEPGSGEFLIGGIFANQFNPVYAGEPIDPGISPGPALSFTTIVPEPASIGLAIALLYASCRRRMD